jgi:hypothetical protein
LGVSHETLERWVELAGGERPAGEVREWLLAWRALSGLPHDPSPTASISIAAMRRRHGASTVSTLRLRRARVPDLGPADTPQPVGAAASAPRGQRCRRPSTETIDVKADDGSTMPYGLAESAQAGSSAAYSFLHAV